MGRPAATSRATASSSRGVTDEEFTAFVKSTYRVLLTRGLRGCYVYFMDAPTRDFFLTRTEQSSFRLGRVAETPTPYKPSLSEHRRMPGGDHECC